MHQKNNLLRLGILILGLIIIIVLATKMGKNARSDDELKPDFAQGISYIQSLESKDSTRIEEIIREQRHLELIEKREQRLQQLISGEISVWTLFEDYLLLGDSRAVGFYYFDFLPEASVWAEGGATIRHLKDNIPNIVAESPSYLFLCYGLNDVSIGYWNTPEEYVTEFEETLRTLQAELPDVTIIISSILVARDPAFDLSSAWYSIPDFSTAVEEMCSEMDGVYFVNNDEISDTYADLWNTDGIHLHQTFYPYWAANMIMTVYDSELEQEEME